MSYATERAFAEQGWQPIESAPRDATVILAVLASTAANRTYGENGHRSVELVWFEEGQWQAHFPNVESKFWRLTHWQPQPALPEVQA